MKKTLAALLVVLFIGLQGAVAAESEYYYYNVSVEKIYVCREGYRVIYRSSGLNFHEMYLPFDWFKCGGKVEEIEVDHNCANYMSVFFKNGEFSHAKLYAPKLFSNPVWKQMPKGDYQDKFNVDGIQLQF